MVVSAASVAAAAVACSSGSASTNGIGTGDGGDSGGQNPAGCPATAPAFQEPCSVTLTCSYDAGVVMNACGTFPSSTTAQCRAGIWEISGLAVSCNPPGMLPDAAGADASGDDGGDGGDGG